jgi:hypothetical protein
MKLKDAKHRADQCAKLYGGVWHVHTHKKTKHLVITMNPCPKRPGFKTEHTSELYRDF